MEGTLIQEVYSTLTMQPYFCKVWYLMSTLMFSFEGSNKYTGFRWWKKTHNRQSLALPDKVHSQERE